MSPPIESLPILLIQGDALIDDVPEHGVANLVESIGHDALGHLLVDLGGVRALHVGVFPRAHLKKTHAKCIDIHGLVIVLIVHLRGHKFRSTFMGREKERERERETDRQRDKREGEKEREREGERVSLV